MKIRFFSNLLVLGLFTMSAAINIVHAQGTQAPVQGNTQGPIPFQKNGVLDGVYVQEHVPTKKVVPYAHLREADALWSKRVWRTIDLREKINLPLYYPLQKLDDRWSFWDVLRTHVFKDEPDITAYRVANPEDIYMQDGDQFKYPILRDPNLPMEEDSAFMVAMKELMFFPGSEATEPLQSTPDEFGQTFDSLDDAGNYVYPEATFDPIEPIDIVQYKMKEDWFFDKQRSVLDVRILGIAPCRYNYSDETREKITGIKSMFWTYFPECRYVFQNYFVFNRQNDSRRMSFDDLFWKRMFSSYVHKESNIFDRTIKDYESGIDALLEAKKIKMEIFKIEHDLWHL